MFRLATFIMVILLLGGWVAPHTGYLEALAVVSGLAWFGSTVLARTNPN